MMITLLWSYSVIAAFILGACAEDFPWPDKVVFIAVFFWPVILLGVLLVEGAIWVQRRLSK